MAKKSPAKKSPAKPSARKNASASKKAAAAFQKAAKNAPSVAQAPATAGAELFTVTKPDTSHDAVWRAKVAIQGMSEADLTAFETENRDLVLHGPGVLAEIEKRRSVLKG